MTPGVTYDTAVFFRNGALDVRAWRSIIANASRTVDGGVEVISPFGLEITNPGAPIGSRANRVYLYAHAHSKAPFERYDYCTRFFEALMAMLKREDPPLFESIVLLRHSRTTSIRLREPEYVCRPGDRMINLLPRVSGADALADYAAYLCLVMPAMLNGTLGEILRFGADTRARRRLWQLALIAFELVKHVAPPSGELQREVRSILASYTEEFNDFFHGRTSTPPSAAETALLARVLSSTEALWRSIHGHRGSETCTTLRAEDMYSSALLESPVSRELAEQAIAIVRRTYEESH